MRVTNTRRCVLLLCAFSGLGPPVLAQEAPEAAGGKPLLQIPVITGAGLGGLLSHGLRRARSLAKTGNRPGLTGPARGLPSSAPPRGTFYGSLNHEASRYAVWGSRRLHLAGAEELDHRSREISRAAERILSRAADRFLGRRLEEVLYRSETVSRLRRAIDHYTAVGFRGRNAIVGAEVQDAQNLPDPAGKSSGRSRVRTSVRLRVDLHPKVLLKTEIGTLRARVELPLSSSEYRLSVRRPLSSRVTSELFAAYPRGDDGHPRAGLHFFLRF